MRLSQEGIEKIIAEGKALGLSADEINAAVDTAAEEVNEGRDEKYAVASVYPVILSVRSLMSDDRNSFFDAWLTDQDTRYINRNSREDLIDVWNGALTAMMKQMEQVVISEKSVREIFEKMIKQSL